MSNFSGANRAVFLEKIRQEEWTGSTAVGGGSFVENVKVLLDYRAKGVDVIAGNEGYHLRDGSPFYKVLFVGGNDDIGLKNA
jgi:hypothetical protein